VPPGGTPPPGGIPPPGGTPEFIKAIKQAIINKFRKIILIKL